MHHYRISRHDPYQTVQPGPNERWPSFAELDEMLGGVRYTAAQFDHLAAQHLAFITALIKRERALPLVIGDLQELLPCFPWYDGQEIYSDELNNIFLDLFREKCWCRLSAPGFFIHYDKDFDMYIGCSYTPEGITQLAARHGLYAEPMISPYIPQSMLPGQSDLRLMTALYITRGDRILLLYRQGSRVVGNSYTGAAGGHMEPNEIHSARACILRELQEETGLTADDLQGLTLRYVTMRLKSGEIRQNFYFFATLKEGCEPGASTEGSLEWHPMDQLDALPMPHTARQVLEHYIAEGHGTDLLYGAVSTKNGAVFTPLTEF